MNKKFVIIAGLVIVLGAAFLLWPKQGCDAAKGACGDSPKTQTSQSKADLIASEVKSGKAMLIDVREPNEFASGHAPDAKLIPLADIEAGKPIASDKNTKIYLYCRSGKRAGVAQATLKKQGYTNVESLGGLADWQALGGKLI